MKKSKKYLKISMLAFFVSVMGFTSVSAAITNFSFTNYALPKYSQVGNIGGGKVGGSSSSRATVTLSNKNCDTVLVKSRALKSDGTWGSYTKEQSINDTGVTTTIKYAYSYGKGTMIQISARNKNWTNVAKKITGFGIIG